MLQRSLYISILVFLATGCTKLTDLVAPPSPREKYLREWKTDTALSAAWQKVFEQSLSDSIAVEFPYRETMTLYSDRVLATSYIMQLNEGQILFADIFSKDTSARVFLDLYKMDADETSRGRILERELPGEPLRFVVQNSGAYRLVVQPELFAQDTLVLSVYTLPVYGFPVAGQGNNAIQSYWGDGRSGGRLHEGIDIFAPRGTPVVAVTDGLVTFTGERGLGGKQVWQRAGLLGKSIYYAHLDSIDAAIGRRIHQGDTLGFVGNSGNARTTSPHLHLGIYASNGAIDPLSYVRKGEVPASEPITPHVRALIVKAEAANLRNAPGTDGLRLGSAVKGDTLLLLGYTDAWVHILTESGARAYVHESLVREIQ